MKHPINYDPEKGRNYNVWGDLYSFKTTSEETGGAHALLEMTVNPGSGTPPHIHHAEDEMFYVLEGELSLWCGEEKIIGRPGSFVAIPKGTTHRWANESNTPAKSLVFLVPGGFDKFLIKIGTPADEGVGTSSRPTKEQIDYAISIAGDYHMEIVP
jgi:quercetin dioxygenase-like cupin family protein